MSTSRALPLCLVLVASCRGNEPVTVFAAASMGPTLEALAPELQKVIPGARLEVELSSSRAACAKVSDQSRSADLVISADSELLRGMLVPEHASRLTRFASNRLVLAAVRDSGIGKRLATEPWQRIVAPPDVRIGIADPEQAPVGRRAVEALRLNDAIVEDAELRVGGALAARLTDRFVRPDVAKLIAPLETGELDAAFIYESEAKQYGFAYVVLDARIDGSATTFYAASVPTRARHPAHGDALLALLLSPTGRRLAALHHLTMLETPVTEP